VATRLNQAYIPPNKRSYDEQTVCLNSLICFLKGWIILKDLENPRNNGGNHPYSIGVKGLIIKGWGRSELTQWDYDMVSQWYPLVKTLKDLKIINCVPHKGLPQNQDFGYYLVTPILDNLINAETLINRR
jgi:hypothetical protein